MNMDLKGFHTHQLYESEPEDDDEEDENITLFELQSRKLKMAAEKYLAGPLAPVSLPTFTTDFEGGQGEEFEKEEEDYSSNIGLNVLESTVNEGSEHDKIAWSQSQASQLEEVIQEFERVCSWQGTLSPPSFFRMVEESQIGNTTIANETLDSGIESNEVTTDLEELSAIPTVQRRTCSILSKRHLQYSHQSPKRSRKNQFGQNSPLTPQRIQPKTSPQRIQPKTSPQRIQSKTPPQRTQSKIPSVTTPLSVGGHVPANLEKSPLIWPWMDTACPELREALTISPAGTPSCSQNSPNSRFILSPRIILPPIPPMKHTRRLLASLTKPLVPESPFSSFQDKVLVKKSLVRRYKKLRRKKKRAKLSKQRQEAESVDKSSVNCQSTISEKQVSLPFPCPSELPVTGSSINTKVTTKPCGCLCFCLCYCAEKVFGAVGPTPAQRLCSSIKPSLPKHDLAQLVELSLK